MKRIVLLIISLIWSCVAFGDVVTVKGYGAMTSGKAVARRQALVDAYRQAINEGGLVEVGSYSQMNNFVMVADVVKTRTHGFIKNYRVITEGVSADDGDMYEVAIEANVVTEPVKGNEGLSEFLELIGKPSILFLVSDDKTQDTALELMLAERFRTAGYEVKTSSDVAAEADVLLQARSGDNRSAASLARQAGVDLVLAGNVKSSVSAMSGGTDVNASLSLVTAQLNVIVPGNGKVLDLASGRARFMSVQEGSDLIAQERAFQNLAKQLSDKLVLSIPQYLSKQPRTVALSVNALPYDELEDMQGFLRGRLGIDGVELKNWQDEVGHFDIDIAFTGPSTMELVKILQNRYPAIQVKQLQSYDIVISM